MATGTVTLHRVLRCPPERVYRAFVTPEAMCKWLPPHGFAGRVHEMDAREGGAWRMSFVHFGSGHAHSFGGRYLDLKPGQKLRYSAQFDDPNLPGEMETTVTLKAVSGGTDMQVVQTGIPEVIPVEQCYVGWQESLTLLALFVEAEIPTD